LKSKLIGKSMHILPYSIETTNEVLGDVV
jgi:hypothetical protein